MDSPITTFADPYDSHIGSMHTEAFQRWTSEAKVEEYTRDVQSVVEEFEYWLKSAPKQTPAEIPFGMQFQGWPIAIAIAQQAPELITLDMSLKSDPLGQRDLGVYATLRVGASTVDTPNTTVNVTSWCFFIIPDDSVCSWDIRFD